MAAGSHGFTIVANYDILIIHSYEYMYPCRKTRVHDDALPGMIECHRVLESCLDIINFFLPGMCVPVRRPSALSPLFSLSWIYAYILYDLGVQRRERPASTSTVRLNGHTAHFGLSVRF